MTNIFITQTVIDILLFTCIFIYIFMLNKRIKDGGDIDRASAIMDSINNLVNESEKIADHFVDTINIKEAEIDAKIAELKKEIARLEKILSEGKKANHPLAHNDKYSNIVRLIDEGLDIEDIMKKTGISKGEIELIKNLQKGN